MNNININWREVGVITASGAVGGLLGWLISVSASADIGARRGIALATALLGGAVAAGTGVYLLANTDTQRFAHAIFFAAVCGISWKPILDTGIDLVNKATVHRDVVSAKNEIDKKVADALQNPANTDTQALLANTVKLAEWLPSVSSPDLQNDARQSAIKAIQVIATNKPQEAPSVLEKIGKRAAASMGLLTFYK